VKFSGKVGNGSMNKRLNFGGVRQMAALVRRVLAKARTVSVLLVSHIV